MKYGFVELVMILSFNTRCDYVIPSDFSVTIPRCYKDVYDNSFFPRIARPWNSLPIECIPLTYDLNGFKLELTDIF